MEPYAAYVAAFTEFTNEVVARGQDLEIKEAIYMAVKAETTMLTNMIPALKKIVGRQREDASVVPSQDLANRFAYSGYSSSSTKSVSSAEMLNMPSSAQTCTASIPSMPAGLSKRLIATSSSSHGKWSYTITVWP